MGAETLCKRLATTDGVVELVLAFEREEPLGRQRGEKA
jgi:hypothetical protein